MEPELSFFGTVAFGYLAGAAGGLLASWVELEFLGKGLGPAGRASYSLIGGVIGSTLQAVARCISFRSSPFAGAIGLMSLPVITGLFAANVYLLPGEPFLTAKSLAVDGAVLFVGLALSLTLTRPASAALRGLGRFNLPAIASAALVAALIVAVPIDQTNGPAPSLTSADRPNVLLVMMDSVRRDHISGLGYFRPTTPRLDRSLGTARVFTAAASASSWTSPSMEWLFSMKGVGSSGERLPSVLASRGYATACFTDNPHLGQGSAILDGFRTVRRSVGLWRRPLAGSVIEEVIERFVPSSDADLVDRAVGWAGDSNEPFFLYVHLMDPHGPFILPPIDGRRRKGRRIEFPVTGMEMTGSEAEDIVARYDAGVRSADRSVARLLEAMEAAERPYIAIVSADHGESLGEEGRWYHGKSLAPELLAVPLFVIGDEVEAGSVAEPVGFTSVVRTILEAAGHDCSSCGGTDLRVSDGDPSVEGELPPTLAFRIAQGHKLVVDAEGVPVELYDLAADPNETQNILDENAALAQDLARDLVPSKQLPRPDPADLERLRSLGYTGS